LKCIATWEGGYIKTERIKISNFYFKPLGIAAKIGNEFSHHALQASGSRDVQILEPDLQKMPALRQLIESL
jgi:hypothetical protein